jgi:hypothetical protein
MLGLRGLWATYSNPFLPPMQQLLAACNQARNELPCDLMTEWSDGLGVYSGLRGMIPESEPAHGNDWLPKFCRPVGGHLWHSIAWPSCRQRQAESRRHSHRGSWCLLRLSCRRTKRQSLRRFPRPTLHFSTARLGQLKMKSKLSWMPRWHRDWMTTIRRKCRSGTSQPRNDWLAWKQFPLA